MSAHTKLQGLELGAGMNVYAKNATQLRRMHAQSVATGRSLNGYTAEQLDAMASRYERMAADPKAALAIAIATIAARAASQKAKT